MYGKKSLTVTLTNLSNNTVCLAPTAILCELKPVEVTAAVVDRLEEKVQDIKRKNIVKELSIDEDNILDSEQKQAFNDLLMKHRIIFSTSGTDIGNCNSIKHQKDLHDERPFKQRHKNSETQE
ncbi:hypothetical protein DPMN_148965 [Dreissena polymorpha]|uniref:Uncharacterized protein n=1 Tax=Dreissena polymorpha TaxID=45954 RepID=A0A9D4FAW3_DREPO|nr:hypothetical protein DPMN_148965 [Dreissena polymorpha]